MKKNILFQISSQIKQIFTKTRLLSLVAFSQLMLPLAAMAQYDEDVGGTNNEGGQGINYTLTSPLINITSISDLLVAILRIFITVATPIVALFIILAGFKYVTARGNAQKVQEATQAITYAIIGGLLILGAVAISGIITNVVNSIAS